nr:HDOD domain-containing protein [uncultured Desulfuromonas sp.]
MSRVFSPNIPVEVEAVLATIHSDIGMPLIAHKVLDLMHSGQVDAHALAAVIVQDQALALRVLKLANSPYYGFSRRISTVQDAVVILGDKALRNMVLILAMKGMHNHFGDTERFLWEESAAYAMAARFIAEKVPGLHPEEAFMAGLMSNVGEVVSNNDNPQRFRTVFNRCRRQGRCDESAASELPYPFTVLGAAVLSSWNFSPLLVASLYYAETDDLVGEPEELLFRMCAVVFLARQLCRALTLGGYQGSNHPVSAGYAGKALGLEGAELKNLQCDFSAFFAENAPTLLCPD